MPNLITALRLQRRDKSRVNVFIDGEFALAVDLSMAATLQKGQELSAAEIERLKTEDECQRAYQHALRYLGYRPRSRAEVERNLRDKGYAPAAINDAVTRLIDQRYLDDAAFARFWLENRERHRPRSARALRYELRQKGIAPSVIDATLAGMDEDSSAWAALEPKLARWQALDRSEFARQVIGFLTRRGFNYAIARQTYERAWATLHPDDTGLGFF
jgi:regulatory protein